MDTLAPVPVGESFVWLLDTINFKLINLFDVESSDDIPYVFAVSPDGSWIIYANQTGEYFRVRNLYDGTDRQITILISPWIWWIPNSDQLLYIKWKNHTKGNTVSINSYDFNDEKHELITDIEFEAHPFIENSIQLSPDGKKLGFIEFGTDELYIIYLC